MSQERLTEKGERVCFLEYFALITSALTVLTTLSMTSCGADNTISSEASESAVTSTADSGKTAKDILSAIEGDHMDASTFFTVRTASQRIPKSFMV